VERRLAGTASAVLNTARQVGGAAGVAVFGAMAAAGSDDQIISGVRETLAFSAMLLTIAAALAYWCQSGLWPKNAVIRS
jgi:DHA2 family methylenomycin A resistance protein-like MFS transporter